MDRENNDRSMIDRTVGEKKELHFPAAHLPVMAWASSCVLRVSRSISHVHPACAWTRRAECSVHDCTIAKTGCMRRLDP